MKKKKQIKRLKIMVDEMTVKLEDVKRELERQLEDEKLIRMSAQRAYNILSLGIKKALGLENWPDFHALYGQGLFAEGVARLLNEEVQKLRAPRPKASPKRKAAKPKRKRTKT